MNLRDKLINDITNMTMIKVAQYDKIAGVENIVKLHTRPTLLPIVSGGAFSGGLMGALTGGLVGGLFNTVRGALLDARDKDQGFISKAFDDFGTGATTGAIMGGGIGALGGGYYAGKLRPKSFKVGLKDLSVKPVNGHLLYDRWNHQFGEGFDTVYDAVKNMINVGE